MILPNSVTCIRFLRDDPEEKQQITRYDPDQMNHVSFA